MRAAEWENFAENSNQSSDFLRETAAQRFNIYPKPFLTQLCACPIGIWTQFSSLQSVSLASEWAHPSALTLLPWQQSPAKKKVDVKYIRRIQYKDYLINACNDCSWILYLSNSFSLCWLAVSSTLQTNKISLKFFGGHHESFSLLLHISWNKTTTHQIKIYQNVIVWSRSKNVLKQLRFSWTWRIKIFF